MKVFGIVSRSSLLCLPMVENIEYYVNLIYLRILRVSGFIFDPTTVFEK